MTHLQNWFGLLPPWHCDHERKSKSPDKPLPAARVKLADTTGPSHQHRQAMIRVSKLYQTPGC